MKYISVAEAAKLWNVSERTVRNYCAQEKIPGAFQTGKIWKIPETAEKPDRTSQKSGRPAALLEVLRCEKDSGISGGIYQKVQIELTYHSNRIEGSRLTLNQTRSMFETSTISMENGTLNVNDIIETAAHFKCIDMVIENAESRLSERFIKQLHAILKNGTSDSRKEWFAVGAYKKLPNEVGGQNTALPEEVCRKMRELLDEYNASKEKSLDDILDFHYQFETIHPFQDGNGRIGRLILLKECLRNDIVPFIIDDEHQMFYYRGLREWKHERGYLRDTCLSAQDKFKVILDDFHIPYENSKL